MALGFEEETLKKDGLFFLPSARIRITNVDKDDFVLHSFCLMPNHFHLMIEQKKDVSISTLILKICTSYAKYLNRKYQRVGHVFQDQFKAVQIENDSQLMWTSAYIHTNPVKDRFVKNPSDWQWSSYNDFALNRDLLIVYKDLLKDMFGTKNDFKKETLRLVTDEKPMSRTVLDI